MEKNKSKMKLSNMGQLFLEEMSKRNKSKRNSHSLGKVREVS